MNDIDIKIKRIQEDRIKEKRDREKARTIGCP